jgi:hypothetical protein
VLFLRQKQRSFTYISGLDIWGIPREDFDSQVGNHNELLYNYDISPSQKLLHSLWRQPDGSMTLP